MGKFNSYPDVLTDTENNWGLSKRMITINNFDQPDRYTIGFVIKHLRNALSHPTELNLEAQSPSTGFKALSAEGRIKTFAFVDSPDICSNRPRYFKICGG